MIVDLNFSPIVLSLGCVCFESVLWVVYKFKIILSF